MTARYPLVRVGGRTRQLPSGDTLLGAGVVNFTDTASTAAPNATTSVSVLTAVSATTNADITIKPKGIGALQANVPDSAATGGNKRGAYAVDWQLARNLPSQVASGANTTISGGLGNQAVGSYASVGGGNVNVSSGSNSRVGGGNANTASGNYSYVGGGLTNTAGADYSFVGGGQNNAANGLSSVIFGGAFATTRGITGAMAWGGASTVLGRAQLTWLDLTADTTAATATRLTSVTGATASAANVNALPNTSTYRCRIEVVARNTTTGDSASWDCKALIKREANAAATSLVGSPIITQEFASSTMTGCVVAITADTTLGALALTVTGITATNIRWSAFVEALEVTN